jgi:uncharacterized protein YhjY with autotransporter beta-barrel domain
MSRLLFVRRQLALLASVTFVGAAGPAFAQTFTVPAGTTDTTAKTLTGTQTGTVEAGGKLTTSGGQTINWTGVSTGVVITNSGIIENTGAGNRAIDAANNNVGSKTLTLTNNAGASIRTVSGDVFRINVPVTGGTITIDNSGLMQAGGTGFAGLGQVLDFRGMNSASAGVTTTIINRSTGVMESLTDDALRPGRNAIISNFGIIRSFGANTSGGANGTADGIDTGGNTGITVTNQTGGLISGARHGITIDLATDITVVNQTGATIIGRNGSGVGSDGTATVTNFGTITGAYAGAGNIFNSDGVASLNGDGDGIDVDFAATITNFGRIEGVGAGGFDSGNRANNSEGVAIGGGTINNFGTIIGLSRGIIVNNDSNANRSGIAATTITNNAGASIIGQNGFAIRLENKLGTAADNDTITNFGTIIGNGTIPNPTDVVTLGSGAVDTNSVGTLDGVVYTGTGSARFIRGDGSAIQMGEGNDVLTNSGVIIGNTGRAINMEGGNDTVTINSGSRITGLVNGGTGTDTLNYNKVGLTDAKRAALQAGQTVNIGGTLYTSFEIVNGTAGSFSSFATGSTRGVASILDNLPNTVAGTTTVVDLIDSIAGASDVNAAMNQLSPSAFQALTAFAINNSLAIASMVGDRLTDVRTNGLSVDMSGAGTAMALFNGGMLTGRNAPIAGQVQATADEYVSGEMTAFADRAQAVAQHPAFASFARAGSGPDNIYKARPAGPGVDLQNGFFVNSGVLIGREGARVDAPATKFTTASVAFGMDRRVTDRLTLGVLGGYARTWGDIDTFGSTTDIRTTFGGLYGAYFADRWYANGVAIYGHNDYDNDRRVFGTPYLSSTNGDQFAIRGTLGTEFRYNMWRINPEASLQYTHVRVDGYTEVGPLVPLTVQEDDASSLRSSLGARFRYANAPFWGWVTPEVRAAWQHEFLNGRRDLLASFVDPGLPGTFVTTTAASGHDFGLLGAGVTGRLGSGTSVSLNYDALIGSNDFVSHLITGRLRYVF